jgi:serine/threonine protein phosphatase 1
LALKWRSAAPPPGEPAPRAAAPPGTVVYAIGDIPGRGALLERIHAGIGHDARLRQTSRRVLVYLGDYLSRGKDARAVLERVLAWRPPGWEIVALKGNHEDLVLRFLDGELNAGRIWLDYGGDEALAHYGVGMADPLARDEATVADLRARFAQALPAAHGDFLRELVVCHREGGYFFAHAGVAPGVPLDMQMETDLAWIRKPFLQSPADHGAVVVHGHCISPEPEVRRNRIGIDTGAYRSGILTCLVLEGEERSFLQTQ